MRKHPEAHVHIILEFNMLFEQHTILLSVTMEYEVLLN